MAERHPDKGFWPANRLPDSWCWDNFTNLFENCTHIKHKIPQNKYSKSGNFPVIDQGYEIIGGYTDRIDCVYRGKLPVIVWGDHTQSNKFIDFCFVQGADGVKVIRPYSELNVKFMHYALSILKLPQRGYSRHFKFLRSSDFPVPPINEQRRIVAKIDACMERSGRAKAALDAIPALLDRYRQSVLAAAFRGDLTADWRARNPGFEPAKVRSIDDLLADPIRNGLSIKGSEQPPGVAALRLTALRSSVVDLSDVRYLPVSSERAKKYTLKAGDVLIGRGNGTKSLMARSAIVPIVNSDIIFPDTAFRVRLDPNMSEPLWFSLIWNSPQIRFQVERLAKTSAGIWKISQSDIRSVEILVPSLSEQMETSRCIEARFSLIDDVEKRFLEASTGLDSLNQSILAKAFRGDLVPQDPGDEPASVLLDRIRADRATQSPKPRRRGRPPASTKAG